MTPILALISILFGGDKAPAQETAAREPAPAAVVVVYQPEEAEAELVVSEPSRWVGAVELPGQVIDFSVTLTESAGDYSGTIDIPVQGLIGGELQDIVREGDELRFTFAIPNLPEFNWPTWVMTLDETGKAATGELRQSGATFPSKMSLDEAGDTELLPRPQHPKRPLPYREIEVAVDAGEHTLAGTLTLPDEETFGSGPYPAAILLTGSGPQDRDETLMGHKPFLVLSDHLTRHGIASLRCDDRGTAGSTGDFSTATMLDFMDDARAAIAFLEQQDEIAEIGLIGHSEGAMIAPETAAGNDDVDFVVLLAGPGVTGEEVLLLQTRVMLGETGVGESFLDTQEELQSQLFDLMKDGADRELIEAKVGELIDLQSPGAAGEVREGLFDQNMAMIDRPWFYHFLTYDPRPMLRKLEQPVLAVNGSKDLQVLTSQNLDEIRRVFEEEGKDNFKAIEFEGLNHLFQPATTGAMSEYGQIETTFDENAMQVISDWILKQLD